MAVPRNAPCPCGSGKKFKLCHGTTRSEDHAYARREAALEEARELALLFPFLRPRGRRLLAHADRAAAGLGDGEGPPEELVEGLASRVGDRERRRLVASYARLCPDPWAGLVRDLGDHELAKRLIVEGAVRAAIAERRIPPRRMLSAVETADDILGCPETALPFLLAPQYVWTVLEASCVLEALDWSEARTEHELRALDELASAWTTRVHQDRVRALARHIRRRLPIDGFPRTSRLLAEGAAEVERDAEFVHEVASTLLVLYVRRLAAFDTALPLAG
ncbi:MAG TPA: SEC-C domain-containing protein [Gaiellaceae bacterium]